MPLDASTVDVGAIKAVQILSDETGSVSDDAGVMARNRDVVKEEMALRMAPNREKFGIEAYLLPLSAASGPDEKAGAAATGIGP